MRFGLLEWFKIPVTSQTAKFMKGTYFSHYLGLKHYKKQIKNWLMGIKVLSVQKKKQPISCFFLKTTKLSSLRNFVCK